LSLKTKVDGLSVVWPQNHWDGFLRFNIKIRGDGFLRFDLKISGDISPSLPLKPVMGFLIESQNQDGGGFLGLGLKTGSYGLVICSSKSPRWFLGLSLKIKQTTVYRLCQKTDRRVTV
jgi:hypothetical protein